MIHLNTKGNYHFIITLKYLSRIQIKILNNNIIIINNIVINSVWSLIDMHIKGTLNTNTYIITDSSFNFYLLTHQVTTIYFKSNSSSNKNMYNNIITSTNNKQNRKRNFSHVIFNFSYTRKERRGIKCIYCITAGCIIKKILHRNNSLKHRYSFNYSNNINDFISHNNTLWSCTYTYLY